MHFSQKKSFPNHDILLPDNLLPNVLGERQLVKLILKTIIMHWLGIFFDAHF